MSIIGNIFNKLTLNGRGDSHPMANMGMTIGTVVDTDDPLQMGRLRIYCADLNDDPKKVQHLPWAVYVSPYGGSINNSSFSRGSDEESATSEGTTQYGFWGIPDLGANVLVACINGDPRRRLWLGCIYEHKETSALLTGKYGDDFDGPLMSTGEPSNPTYKNLETAFNNDKNSPEWKTRGGEYSGMENSEILSSVSNANMQSSEDDSWVKEKLGAMGYDWSSFKNLKGFLASKIFGFSSPGLHSITFDDRPFNSRIKLRTTAGHQIILDDTNERIYVNTAEGKSWVELDQNGNIDIYSEKRISMRAKEDINFSTDETFRVKATRGIFLYAGDDDTGPALPSDPGTGEIRIQSSDQIHLISDGDMYRKINGDMHSTILGNFYGTVGTDESTGSYNLKMTRDDLNIITPNNALSLNEDFAVKAKNILLQGEDEAQLFVVDPDDPLNRAYFSASLGRVEVYGFSLTLAQESALPLATPIEIAELVYTVNLLKGLHDLLPMASSFLIAEPLIPSFPEFDVVEPLICPWTNRVPDHEPWPRVLKRDISEGDNNKQSTGYRKNIGWNDQFDNVTPEGREPIGQHEGENEIERGKFWRR